MANHEDLQKDSIILYTGEEGSVTVEVLFKDETMWLTQKTMAQLFDVKVPAIAKHLKNIFSRGRI